MLLGSASSGFVDALCRWLEGIGGDEISRLVFLRYERSTTVFLTIYYTELFNFRRGSDHSGVLIRSVPPISASCSVPFVQPFPGDCSVQFRSVPFLLKPY